MDKRQKIISSVLVLTLVGFGMITRFIDHPANFTAIGATALFAGVVFPKKWGMLLPIVIMIVSDAFLGFHNIILFTWGSFAVTGLIGTFLRSRVKPGWIIGGALLGSIQFYLITNWAVWQFGTMYPHTFSGLTQSYIMGLPFLRNMVVGDILYTVILFGAYAFAFNMLTNRLRGVRATN